MSFEEKLKRAIRRGQQHAVDQAELRKRKQMTEDEYRRKHTECRLAISDKIEIALKTVADHIPGFTYETVYGDKGWGGAISRDDVQIRSGKRTTLFSRLEITVRPFSDVKIVDLVAKGTVRNQEIFTRDFHEMIDAVEIDSFLQSTDQWVLEYVEKYSDE